MTREELVFKCGEVMGDCMKHSGTLPACIVVSCEHMAALLSYDDFLVSDKSLRGGQITLRGIPIYPDENHPEDLGPMALTEAAMRRYFARRSPRELAITNYVDWCECNNIDSNLGRHDPRHRKPDTISTYQKRKRRRLLGDE